MSNGILAPRTDIFRGDRGDMIWVKTARSKYGLSPELLERRRSLYGKPIHRERRKVSDPRCYGSTNRRLFILEAHCPELAVFAQHVTNCKLAVLNARAKGLIPVGEFASALSRPRSTVRRWCQKCPWLPGRVLRHDWIQAHPEKPEELFIDRAEVRPLKAALEGTDTRYLLVRGERYISTRDATKRSGRSKTWLRTAHRRDSKSLRREPGPRGGDYWHEGDVNDIVPRRDERGAKRPPQSALTKSGERIVTTAALAALIGCDRSTIHQWGTGKLATPNRLPLRKIDRTFMGHQVAYWSEAEGLAISAARAGASPAAPPPPVSIHTTGLTLRSDGEYPLIDGRPAARRLTLAEYEAIAFCSAQHAAGIQRLRKEDLADLDNPSRMVILRSLSKDPLFGRFIDSPNGQKGRGYAVLHVTISP